MLQIAAFQVLYYYFPSNVRFTLSSELLKTVLCLYMTRKKQIKGLAFCFFSQNPLHYLRLSLVNLPKYIDSGIDNGNNQ